MIKNPEKEVNLDKKDWVKDFFRLLSYLKIYWKEISVSLFFLLLGTIISLTIPLFIREIIDVALPQKNFHHLFMISVYMAGIYVLYSIFIFFTDYFYLKVSNGIIYDLRKQMYYHLQHLSINYLEKTHSGQIVAKIMGDVDNLRIIATNVFMMIITDSITMLVILGFMFYLSWELTFFGLSTLVLLLLILRIFNKRIRDYSFESRKQYAGITEDVQESIGGMKEIQAFVAQKYWGKRFSVKLRNFFSINIKAGIISSISRILSSLIISIGPVLIYFLGGMSVIKETFTIGALIAFVAYITKMYQPVNRLVMINVQLQTAMASVFRIFEFLDTKPEIKDSANPVSLKEVEGNIRFENVSFSYNGKDKALHNINIKIKKGETIALVGQSGSGKTTFVNLLCRFFEPVQGKIFIDDVDISDTKLNDLREHIGLVPQDPFLFDDSVIENIRFGKREAKDDEIIGAAHQAHAHEFIAPLAEGYHTKIGERAVRLSGGQKQRISIARTILKNPEIIIFDEATSSLDSHSEKHIRNTIMQILKNRTTFIISHRLSSVEDADRILVFDKGSIVEQGSHSYLLKKNGLYKKLYEEQFSKQ